MKLESDLDWQPWSQNLREITHQNFHDPKEGNGAGIVDESGNIKEDYRLLHRSGY